MRSASSCGSSNLTWWSRKRSLTAMRATADHCYTTKILKPMGLTFVQKEGGPIEVETVDQGSNAERAGVAQGDELLECSAVVFQEDHQGTVFLDSNQEKSGHRPYNHTQTIAFDCRGQDFDVVMKAIASNATRLGHTHVELLLMRHGTAA